MSGKINRHDDQSISSREAIADGPRPLARACPACGSSRLQDIRAKLVCMHCHTIIETCCEGGRG